MPKRGRPERVEYPPDYVHKVGFKCDKHQIVLVRSSLTGTGDEVWRDHTYHADWKRAIPAALNTQLKWLVAGEPGHLVKDSERFLQLWDKTVALVNDQLEQSGQSVRVPARKDIEVDDEFDADAVIDEVVDDLVHDFSDL